MGTVTSHRREGTGFVLHLHDGVAMGGEGRLSPLGKVRLYRR